MEYCLKCYVREQVVDSAWRVWKDERKCICRNVGGGHREGRLT